MTIITSYRRMVGQITARLSWCQKFLPVRFIGTMGLLSDLTAEGARQAFLARLPGNPQQADDAAAQSGADAKLFRYRGESQASWKARIRNPWPQYEQAGTAIQVLRAVNEWGAIVFPGSWDPAKVFLVEGVWATFTVFLGAGLVPWGPGVTYGSGARYGDGTLYGISSPNLEDIDTLRRIIRKWKRSINRARITVIFSGVVYDEPGIVYDGGATYSGTPPGTGAVYNQTGVTYDGGSIYDGTTGAPSVTSATIDV